MTRRYTSVEKEAIVKACIDSGKHYLQFAADYGVPKTTIYNWLYPERLKLCQAKHAAKKKRQATREARLAAKEETKRQQQQAAKVWPEDYHTGQPQQSEKGTLWERAGAVAMQPTVMEAERRVDLDAENKRLRMQVKTLEAILAKKLLGDEIVRHQRG